MRAIRLTALLFAASILPGLTGCGIGQAEVAVTPAADEETPIPVRVGRLTRADVPAVHHSTTHLEAAEAAAVLTRVAGEVEEILVEEGDRVTAGQVMARLDGERLRLVRAEVKARLDQTKREYRRNVQLHERGLVSQTAFESLRYDMEALESEYRLATLELRYASVRAPFDGVVTERLIKPGNTLPEGTVAFRLADVSVLEASLTIPERELHKFAPGQAAELVLDALPDEPAAAEVIRVSPTVDATSGTFRVTLSVPNEDRRLRPGMFARARVAWDIHHDALLAPAPAIVEDDTERAVWVVRDDRAWRRSIVTGIASPEHIEVLEGLEPAELLIVSGQSALRDGSPVEIQGEGVI